MSKMDFSVNRSPLKTVVSRKVISFSDISAVNFIVGWKLLASLIKVPRLFCYSPKGRKSHQCNASILLAWCYFARLGLFQSPPCRYLQKTLLFLCSLQPYGFGDNCLHWTQMSFLLVLGKVFPFVVCGDRRVIVVKQVVCFTYYFCSLFLWYVRV